AGGTSSQRYQCAPHRDRMGSGWTAVVDAGLQHFADHDLCDSGGRLSFELVAVGLGADFVSRTRCLKRLSPISLCHTPMLLGPFAVALPKDNRGGKRR